MKRHLYKALLLLVTCVTMGVHTGCIDEVHPTSVATPDQLQSSESLGKMLNGLPAFVVTWNTYGSSSYENDFGYPCQMYMREVQGEDFPIKETYYDYWYYLELASELRYMYYYSYFYYYSFIHNANHIISVVDEATASDEALQYLGSALGYRALCYLDVARLFEYKPTGYSIDDEANASGVYGLTVPIVTEGMSSQELKNNPRVPFQTMYRFILTDLNKAEQYIVGYKAPTRAYIDLAAIYGLQARLWLEIATRMEDAEGQRAILAAEGSDDGYDNLGVKSAAECYAKVRDYAQKSIDAHGGYPLTEAEWTDPTTGFNTVQPSWILSAMVTTPEQADYGYYWCTFLGTVASEPQWGMPRYGGGFRMIGTYLYDQMGDSDWRKQSWLAPDAVGKKVPAGYKTLLNDEAWGELPAYANLKFRAANGAIEDVKSGLIASLPMMRLEEMYFDLFEALAHTDGVATAAARLQSFVRTYRDAAYTCSAATLDEFIQALMIQRRIEFWGEGINYFDYKRLKLPIKRSQSSNFPSGMALDTRAGYVAPWMNYYIPENEKDQNPAIILNPNPSGLVQSAY